MSVTVPVDGALATSLQARGLPTSRAADTWVDTHPNEVARLHQEFVTRGAQVVRTATLCSRGDGERLRRAVALARSADPKEVWLSIGPVGPDADPVADLEGALHAGADRVVLETFVHPDELLAAAAWLAERGARIVGSLVPGPEGLLARLPYPTEALRRAGVEVLGLNCGTDPRHAVVAWRAFRDDGLWFVAPPWGEGLAEAWRSLHGEVAFLGGCCGVGPSRWEASWPT